MTVLRREKVPGPWKRTENDLTPLSGPKKFARRHRQNFRKFDGPGNEKSRTSILGESPGEGWGKLIEACGPVKEMIFERDSLRILFACTADNLSGDLKKHLSPQKCKSGQGTKTKEALWDEVDGMKRLFRLKKWHSKTLETWVYPREQKLRSVRRLLRAVNEEYQALCKEAAKKRKAQEKKAQELKEEGFAANPVTKFPPCENKESLENVTAPSDDLIEENLSEDAAAKELSTSEAGALSGMTKQAIVEVADVYAVVRAKEAEVKKHQAECVWVYDIRRTEDGEGRLVSCVDMLQFLVPKGLLTGKEDGNSSFECPGNELRFGQSADEA